MEVTPLPEIPYSCGRTEDELWSRLRFPPDDHERHCHICQAQRRRLSHLSDTTTLWKSEEEEDDGDDSLLGGIRDRVMGRIRTEIRRGVRFTIHLTPHGPLEISGYLLLETLREAADGIPHVELQNHKILPGSQPGTISLALSLAMEAGQDGVQLAQQTRQALSARFSERIGISLAGIDIILEDVIHDD